jgi:hypothetical protein
MTFLSLSMVVCAGFLPIGANKHKIPIASSNAFCAYRFI